MPLISFTPSDKLAAITAEAGWVPVILTECTMKASSSGASINFWCVFKITGGKYMDKEVKCTMNTKSSGGNTLGDMYMMPHGALMTIEACVNNRLKDGRLDIEAVPLDFNTDDILNKPLDMEVGVATTEGGSMINFPKNFLPAGKGVGSLNGNVPF